MDLVELWLLLKTRYEEHYYNVRQITQIKKQLPHVISGVDEVAITVGIQPVQSGRKITKNQAEALRIKYCTNLSKSLEESGKYPAATHVRNMQQRQEDRTLARWIKYIEDRFRKPGTTFITQQKTYGSTLVIPDKTLLEKVVIGENVKTFHHSEEAL